MRKGMELVPLDHIPFRRMKRFFLYIYILVLPFSCFAQKNEPLHFQFTIEDGLPSNRIYDILQDSKGYLWIATANGLVRFNGKEFREFSTVESVNPEYSYLHELKDGSIWCVNFGNQVFKVNGDSLRVVEQFKPYFNDRKYFKLHEWRDSVLYLENKERIVSYDPFENRLEEISNITKTESVTYFCIGSKNMFYRIKGSDSNSNRFIVTTISGKEIDHSFVKKVHGIRVYSSEGQMYVYGYSEIGFSKKGIVYRINELNDEKLSLAKVLSELEAETIINSISSSNKKDTWISTSRGMINTLTHQNILSKKNITRVIKNHEGNYFAATYDSGLFFIPNPNIHKIEKFKNRVHQIQDISETKLIIGEKNNFIHLYDVEKTEVNNSLDIGEKNAQKISFLPENNSIIFNYPSNKIKGKKIGGVNILDHDVNFYSKNICELNKNTFLTQKGKNSLHIYNVSFIKEPKFELSEKWNLNIDTSYNEGIYISKVLKDTSLINIENIFYQENIKKIWVAGNNKTYTEHLQEFKEFKQNNGKSIQLNCFAHNKDGGIVAGLRKSGLVFIKGDSITSKINNETYNDYGPIRKIIHIDSQLISLAQEGIIISDNKGNILHTLDETDGFKGSIINDISYLDGKLWVGSSKGLFSIPIDKIKDNNSQPLVHITHFFINNKKATKKENIFPNNSDVEIFFDGISYKGRKNSLYKYRLNQYENWKTLDFNSKSIRFPNLSSGNYSFQIKIINEEGTEGNSSILNFKVLSPIWLRWWFILIAISIISSIVYFLYQRQIKRTERENQLHLERVERENQLQQEIRASKLSALQSRMNPHFIFNSLNSIQDFIIKLDKIGANEYLGIFSDLMRTYLSQSERDKVELDEEIEALNLYLKLEKLRFGDIDIIFHVDKELKKMDIMIPPLFIQPYVENAFKHGLLHKKDGDKKIEINFTLIPDENQLKIIIKDNGVGRKKVLEIQNKNRTMKGLSYSTKANQTRLELLNHNRESKIEVKTMDLMENNIPKGTQIIINIPLEILDQ